MGVLLKRAIISPGTFPTNAGTITLSAQEVRRIYQNSRAMMDAGMSIPLPLESISARPKTQAEKMAASVAGNCGWLRRLSLGNDGSLVAEMSINGIIHDGRLLHDDRDITGFIRNRVVSIAPEIAPSFRDGSGRTWRDVVLNIALLSRDTAPVALSRASWYWPEIETPVRFSPARRTPAEPLPDVMTTMLSLAAEIDGENGPPTGALADMLKML
jgi:hypothetical protein